MLKMVDNEGVVYYDRATINKIYGQDKIYGQGFL
jgi:hypothetical protein